MQVAHDGESRIIERGFQYQLLIIEILIFLIPSLIIVYIFHINNFFLKISHMTIISLTLVLVLSGMIILRQIFNRFLIMVNLIRKGMIYDTDLSAAKEDIYDLHEITTDFSRLMDNFENTTAELKHRVFELFILKELIETTNNNELKCRECPHFKIL